MRYINSLLPLTLTFDVGSGTLFHLKMEMCKYHILYPKKQPSIASKGHQWHIQQPGRKTLQLVFLRKELF